MAFHHVHLHVPDRDAATEWYLTHFGGKRGHTTPLSNNIYYGALHLSIRGGYESLPPSSGSALDHIAFSVSSAAESEDRLLAAGASEFAGHRYNTETFNSEFIVDPWGTTVELVDALDCEGFHHAHLVGPDPLTTSSWYANTTGGQATKLAQDKRIYSIRYKDVTLLFSESDGELAPSEGEGRVLNHMGWWMDDLERVADALRRRGVTFTVEPRGGETRIAFIEGPERVQVELVSGEKERPI